MERCATMARERLTRKREVEMASRIVPTKGFVGPKEGVTTRLPKTLIAKIEEIAKETGNSRAETILFMLQWAAQAYDSENAEK